jgi:Uma2 family endonuclease
MATVSRQSGVRRRRWTKSEYYRLGKLGFFDGQRVELIEGTLLVLGPQQPPHATVVTQSVRLLDTLFRPDHHARSNMPLDLGQTTEPEPDISVVAGPPAQYRKAHPTTAVLLVEVSDANVSYDRRHKGSLYARAGIADYWLVNLVRRRLEVYRVPVADARSRFGFRYSSRTDLLPGTTVSPLALPHQAIAVADLFP